MSRTWTRVLILALFLGGLGTFFALGGPQWLTLDTLKAHRDGLLAFTRDHWWLMAVSAVTVYATATAFSVPGATILSLAVGLMFGRWMGTVFIVLAATTGAVLVFLAARYLFADAARQRLQSTRAQRLIQGFHQDAFHYLLFLRLVPIFPFWLVNLVPAFTPVTVRTYAIATAIGITPGAFVFANLGESLGRIDSMNELVSVEILAALALLGLFALIPVLYRKFRGSQAPAAADPDQDTRS